ncbi:MAG: acyl-CoA thioesterase [Bradymonadaceae bacterium]
MDGFPHETICRVRFRDTDAMKMANHAVIISYLEEARTEYMAELVDLTSVEDIDYVMASVQCDYRSPARYGERMCTGVRVADIGESSVTLAYRVAAAGDGRLIAEGETVQVFYDYENGESKPVPAAFRRAVEAPE